MIGGPLIVVFVVAIGAALLFGWVAGRRAERGAEESALSLFVCTYGDAGDLLIEVVEGVDGATAANIFAKNHGVDVSGVTVEGPLNPSGEPTSLPRTAQVENGSATGL